MMDDAIYRQAVIDACNDLCERNCGRFCACTQDHIDEIRKIPSAQQWIPCSERLPEEDGQEVLFSSRFGRVHIGKYHDDSSLNKWFSYRDKFRLMNDEVTAWMPLPEPYKEGDE